MIKTTELYILFDKKATVQMMELKQERRRITTTPTVPTTVGKHTVKKSIKIGTCGEKLPITYWVFEKEYLFSH